MEIEKPVPIEDFNRAMKFLSPDKQEELAAAWVNMYCRYHKSSFPNFLEFVFQVVNPGQKYLPNWHVDLMAEYLAACERGELTKLIINIPPRMMKSLTVSVAWPAWLLGHDAGRRIICASYAQKLSLKLSVDCRLVIEHPLYRKMFPNVILTSDQNEKGKFVTTERGHRIATSTGSGTLGEGGNFLIADDLHSVADAQSDVIRQSQLDWFDTGFATRLDDKKTGVIAVIMQRLHGGDLTGHLMDKGFTRVKIPIENTGKTITFSRFERKFVYPHGALLQSERMGRKEIDQAKLQLGTYSFSGQMMQEPVPVGGGIFKRQWFKLFPALKDDGSPNPFPRLIYIMQSYDTAFTEKTTGDPTAHSAWGIFNRTADPEEAPVYCALLLDCWKENIGFPELRKKAMAEYKAVYGPNNKAVNLILIEEKGSGKSLIQELQLAGLPVRGYNPGKADKVARAHAVSPMVEAGRVYVLESENNPGAVKVWAQPFLKEVCEFPFSQDGDDFTDTFSQALIALEHMEFIDLEAVTENDPDEEEYDYSEDINNDEPIYG